MISDDILHNMKFGELVAAYEKGLISPEKYYTTLGYNYVKVELPSLNKEVITTFCTNQSITLDDDFFDLGGLGCAYMSSRFSLGMTDDFIGTSLEKTKHSLLNKLFGEVCCFNDQLDYFKRIDSLYYTSLYISNTGTLFDEDIDIKIFVDKGHIISIREIPKPDDSIIKDVVEQD